MQGLMCIRNIERIDLGGNAIYSGIDNEPNVSLFGIVIISLHLNFGVIYDVCYVCPIISDVFPFSLPCHEFYCMINI